MCPQKYLNVIVKNSGYVTNSSGATIGTSVIKNSWVIKNKQEIAIGRMYYVICFIDGYFYYGKHSSFTDIVHLKLQKEQIVNGNN